MTPEARPTGWVLIGKDNAPATAVLYATLAAACAAEERYRAGTGQRALPSPVWTRVAWTMDSLTGETR